MTPYNYLRQAIPAIKETIYQMNATLEYVNKTFALLDEAQKAVKFILPKNGVIFDNKLKGLPDVIRLPYDEIVIEYCCSVEGGRAANHFGNDQTIPARKRIVYAQQMGESIEVAAVVCSVTPFGDRWHLLPYVSEIIPRTNVGDAEIVNLDMREHKDDYKVEKVVGAYYDIGGMAQKVHGDDWAEHAYYNLGDECQAVLSLIEALSCSNVKATPLATRQKLNKSAAKRGALPFDEYHILTLDGQSKSTGNSKTFADRRSPREHLRRGHIRQLENKKIWINSMVVNAGNHGKIHKSYELEAA